MRQGGGVTLAQRPDDATRTSGEQLQGREQMQREGSYDELCQFGDMG